MCLYGICKDTKRKLSTGGEHAKDIRSVSIRLKGALDGKKLNGWMGKLLMANGNDILRMKGILEIDGETRRVVFQGVHMIFDGRPDRTWKEGEDRTNTLVFIGRNLNEEELNAGLSSCLAN